MRRFQTVFTAKITMADESETTIYNWSNTPLYASGVYYEPCIVTVPTHDGKVGVPVWGQRSQSRISSMQISAVKYPLLLEDQRLRNAKIEFTVKKRTPYGSLLSKDVFVGVIDSISKSKEIYDFKISNYLAELDRSANQEKFGMHTTNYSIAGQTIPFTIGKALSCPLVATNENDDWFVGCDRKIIEYMTVYDNGDRFDETIPDWVEVIDPLTGGTGVDLAGSDYGVITADINGPRGEKVRKWSFDKLEGFGNFYNWIGNIPSGWSIYENKGSTISNSPSQECRMQTNGFAVQITYDNYDLIEGEKYRLTFDTHANTITSGTINVRVGNITIESVAIVGSSPQSHIVEFTMPTPVVHSRLTIHANAPNEVDVSVDNVVLEQDITTTCGIENFLYHLMVTMGGIDESKINWSSINQLHTDKNYEIGYFTDKVVNVQTVLNEVNSTYNSWIIDNGDGLISMNYLKDPSGQPVDFAITKSNQAGPESVENDWGKGLKDSIGCRKNYYVWDRDRLSAQVSNKTANLLIKDYRKIKTTEETIHPFYSHAIGNCARDSLIFHTGNGQLEVDQVCGLYTKMRYFTTVPVTINEFDIFYLEYGDIISFEGEEYVLVGKKFQYADNQITLTLWN